MTDRNKSINSNRNYQNVITTNKQLNSFTKEETDRKKAIKLKETRTEN